MRLLAVALVGLLVAVALACTSRPIAMSAARGTTIVFPIGPDAPNTPVGFATTSLGRADRQFGNTVFVLKKRVGTESPTQCSGTQHDLVVRWITRAWPDPASPAGISNSLGGYGGIQGQVLAAIDIPSSALLGEYCWSIRNEVADPNAPPETEGDIFRFWSSAPYASMGYFEIVQGIAEPNIPNPLEGFYGNGVPWALGGGMAELIPYHKIAYELVGSSPRPAAGDIVFTYPEHKIVVKTVYEENQLGRGSIVRWKTISTADPTRDELQVWYADPDRSIARLSIVFDVMENQTPLWTADITQFNPGGTMGVKVVGTQRQEKYYDLDGNDISASFILTVAGVW